MFVGYVTPTTLKLPSKRAPESPPHISQDRPKTPPQPFKDTFQNQPKPTGHWKATGRILGNFLWKILYKNLDLKGGGVQGQGRVPGPCTPPFKIQIFVSEFPQGISENPPGCLPVARPMVLEGGTVCIASC